MLILIDKSESNLKMDFFLIVGFFVKCEQIIVNQVHSSNKLRKIIQKVLKKCLYILFCN